MALDFDLNLIMPEDSMALFSRGALEMTVKLIKSKSPELADEINTILDQPPLPTGNEDSENAHQNIFHVQLPADKVNAIVGAILPIVQTSHGELPLGISVVAKALFKDWTDLAQFTMGR